MWAGGQAAPFIFWVMFTGDLDVTRVNVWSCHCCGFLFQAVKVVGR